MERSDGKNPFDPETYIRPAATIQTMLELRAFCADFFEKRIRTSVNTNEEDIAAFLTLITHSPNFFARARAVIPELQAPAGESFPSILNDNVQVFLYATQDVRGPPGKKWEHLPEEPAWTRLAKDGFENYTKNVEIDGLGHKKQLSNASARASPMDPTMLAPGKAEVRPSDFPPHSSMSVKSKLKNLPKKLDLSSIPTFVPRNAMGSEELVWSPTSGTRQRRPDETYQQSTNARPANPIQSGQEIHPNLTSAYNLRNQYLFHGDRDFSDSPSKNHRHSDSIMRTPPPQFKSTLSPLNPSAASSNRSKENLNPRRKRRNNLEDTPFSDSVDRMMEMATMKHDPNSKNSPSSHYDTTAYPVEDLSLPTSPSQFRGPRYPSNQVRGVYDAEPFLAPPSVPDYGSMHQTGRGMYGGSPSPFQGQLGPFRPGPDTASFYPSATYAPDPQIWSTNHSPQPRRGALPNQMPNQIIQPIPQMMSQAQMPRFMGQAQMPPPMAQVPNSETLSVPPQGYMDPLDYWNMLHQRETEIRTRLQNANRPMTDQERQYISLLGEARINTVATQMPARGSMSKGKWLRELGRTLRSIWKTGPGGTGFHPVIVARKEDYEKAIEREIERTSQERERRKFGSALDHAYGA